MEMLLSTQESKPLLLADYTSELKRGGVRVIPGESGTAWVGYEFGALMRMPSFHLAPPVHGEVPKALWSGRVAALTYLLRPDKKHPANAWLYVCSNGSYKFENLPSAMRRNVRRGLKELQIKPITLDQLLSHGAEAFCDTRRRVGLSDGTAKNFHERFRQRGKYSPHVFLGAWKDDKLAAFLSIAEVEDWVEIEGCFSSNALLHLRPNDTLFFYALSHYLTERKCRIVSYGVSSIQEAKNLETLHAFKTKVGFEARPVHRAFVLHPLLYPLKHRFALRAARLLLGLAPRNRLLKKTVGALASVLDNQTSI